MRSLHPRSAQAKKMGTLNDQVPTSFLPIGVPKV